MTGSAPPPGPHGGDGSRLAAALGVDPSQVLDLSLSMNPVAPDAAEVVGKHLDRVASYPDPSDATAAMAAVLGVDVDRVLLTNGGAEAIALVTAELGGTAVEPEFGLHPRHDRGPEWRSNPNNPTGRLAARDERAGVWDEAFYSLTTGHWTRGDADAGSVVVGSLTKLFACPGLRVGYVLAPDGDLIARLHRRQPAWSVNALAAASVPDLLERADLPAWAAAVAELRAQLVDLLTVHGLPPDPSDANWVLAPSSPSFFEGNKRVGPHFSFKERGGVGVRDALAAQGVLVRDCASFGLPDRVRIAVPDERGLSRLARALEAIT